MGSIDYRLGELRIKEGITGDLSWVSHFGFGEYREGRCFLKGGILILGQARGEGIGFLKGEFLEGLRKLPPWTRTDHYCLIDDIVSCVTGQEATEAAIRRWCELSGDGETSGALSGETAVAAYRLGKYQVTMGKDGLIQYRTYIGRDRLVIGEAFLVEGILFLSRTETAHASGARERFLAELKRLPKWDKTEFFSFASLLKECGAANAAPSKMGRRMLAEIGSARVSRKVDQDSGNQKPAHTVYSRFDHAERLISNLVKTTLIMLKCLVVIMGQAAKALWPLLTRSCRWAWKKIRNRLRKN